MLASLLAIALSSVPAIDRPPPRERMFENEVETGSPTGPSDRTLRSRAIGLGTAGVVVGVAWLSTSAGAAWSDLAQARAIDTGDSACFDFCFISPFINPMLSPVAIVGAGFAGGALHAHGRWLARNHRGLGKSARTARVMLGAGLGLMIATGPLLGGGLALVRFTESARAEVWLRGLAWGGATATLTAGASLAGFGHGIRRGQRERSGRVAWSVAPVLGGMTGIAISGRF